jgi:D-alanyl-D-alanine carboxypeptidase
MQDVNDFFAALFRGDLMSDTSPKEMTKTDWFPLYGLGIWKWSQGCTDDPESANKLDLWDDQMASALQETLDRLCR